MGLELCEQLKEHKIDSVVCGIGGGGLISGVASVLKRRMPHVRVVGVQPEGADSMLAALKAGKVVQIEKVPLCSGPTRTLCASPHCYRMLSGSIDALRR